MPSNPFPRNGDWFVAARFRFADFRPWGGSVEA